MSERTKIIISIMLSAVITSIIVYFATTVETWCPNCGYKLRQPVEVVHGSAVTEVESNI